MLKNFTLNRLLALFVSVAFAFLTIDSLIEHFQILTKEPVAFIPICFAATASIIGVVTVMKWDERRIKILHVILITSCVVALAGLYFHIAEDDDEEGTQTEQTQNEAEEKDKPPLAPLAFGGIAIVGLLGTTRKWQAEVVEQ